MKKTRLKKIAEKRMKENSIEEDFAETTVNRCTRLKISRLTTLKCFLCAVDIHSLEVDVFQSICPILGIPQQTVGDAVNRTNRTENKHHSFTMIYTMWVMNKQ